MTPVCPKCAGMLAYKPADILGAESVTCRSCGWYLEKQPLVSAKVEVLERPTNRLVTFEEETVICNLRRYSGMTMPEIAVATKVPLGSVKNVLRRNGIRTGDTSVFAPKKTGTNTESPWRRVHLFPQRPKQDQETGAHAPANSGAVSATVAPENEGGGGGFPTRTSEGGDKADARRIFARGHEDIRHGDEEAA